MRKQDRMLRVGDKIMFKMSDGSESHEEIIGFRNDGAIAVTDRIISAYDGHKPYKYNSCFIAMFKKYDSDTDTFVLNDSAPYNKNCFIVEDGDPAIHDEWIEEQYG